MVTEVKISELPAATSANGTMEFEVNDSLVSKKVTGSQIQTLAQSFPSGTANGLLYLNGSKVATSGSALTFNGTNTFTVIPATGTAYNRTESTQYSTWLQAGAGNANVFWEFSAGTPVRWVDTSSGELMRLTSTGLGIGTSSPNNKLTVEDSTAYNGITVRGNAAPTIRFFNGTSTWKTGISGNNGANFAISKDGGADDKLTIDSSGNLGLGVTPSAWESGAKVMQFSTAGAGGTTGNTASIWARNDSIRLINGGYFDGAYKYSATGVGAAWFGIIGNSYQWNIAPSGTAGNAITFTQAMTLDASGNLLVGTTGALPGTNTARSNFYSSAGTLYAATSDASFTSDVVRLGCMRSSSSAYNLLQCFSGNGSTDVMNSTRMYVRGDGGIGNYQANDVNLSDRREKTNFAPAGEYLSKICAIPVQTFNYIDQNMEEDPSVSLGVVAQDVQAFAPELVTESNWGTEENPKMRLSIYQTDLQYALMKCIQEQQAIIEQLKADVDTLKAQLKA